MHEWKVVPLSAGQLLDVRPEDVLEDGLYRKCCTYRGGGGYDQFPYICARRIGQELSEQFIVQLYGCNLDCPYCYVTRAGVWGEPTRVSTRKLVDAFDNSGQEVFHLMGGAPALQMKHWPELIEELAERDERAPFGSRHYSVFHSDLLLTEGVYSPSVLARIARPNCLYAIDVKGLTPEQWLKNTRRPLNEALFWSNWRELERAAVPAYVTFTNVRHAELDDFWRRADENGVDSDYWREDAFVIGLVDYEATAHVDDVPWGNRRESHA